MTTEFPLQRKITKKKCPFSLLCVVFVDLLETLVTKITIGCKRHGTDIAFSKILESKRVPLFYVVDSFISFLVNVFLRVFFEVAMDQENAPPENNYTREISNFRI